MKKAFLISVVIALFALQVLLIYAYQSNDFKEVYDGFGQNLPTLYTPIETILKNSFIYKLTGVQLIMGLAFIAKNKFGFAYAVIGLMAGIVLVMLLGVYGT